MAPDSIEDSKAAADKPYEEPLKGREKKVYIAVLVVGAITAFAAAVMMVCELWGNPNPA